MGLIIFSVIDNNSICSEQIKGENNKLFAISDEGLNAYFYNERSEGHENQG